MVDATSDLVYRTNHDWSEVDVVGGNLLFGRPGSLTPDWLDVLVHPDDRDQVRDAIARARATQTPFSAEHRLRSEDGSWVWVSSRAVPIRPIGGDVTEWFGAATDITARRQHEEHQRLLLNELNHRVKNTLAIVQSLALQTLRGTDDMGLACDRFEARLHALAQAHDVLTRQQWEHATLQDIVRTAIAPCLVDDPERFDIEGPDMQLDPQRALALSMALHELCSNATKYGALSARPGRVRIRWRAEVVQGRRSLVLSWEEVGGPPVTAPAHRGFGSRLIERGLRHDLGGEVALDFGTAGVTCRITAPLPNLEVAA
ncbi:PAS domain-containing protein [Pseudoxanthomonas sp. SL93]|uniref:sensor histidine kinase n=1 Tax=Pseudoxanthomonas sp. SL93 TaxID=2995142 RepID=UPI00227061A1|nr:HWE histidine kinase domain-containing protein [Pseudoxanthomonas sp. SL93]WAC64928.1 PAS domain-containing protein [Pseudoxanthomonas sp. SL93]